MFENVKHFVTQTLGCKCPDEVFNRIDVERDVALFNGARLKNRIIIGDRLLLYIIEINDKRMMDYDLIRIVQKGLNERDVRGLNRFRIIIVTENYNEIKVVAQKKFKAIKERDEKVHLHVINKDEYSQF